MKYEVLKEIFSGKYKVGMIVDDENLGYDQQFYLRRKLKEGDVKIYHAPQKSTHTHIDGTEKVSKNNVVKENKSITEIPENK